MQEESCHLSASGFVPHQPKIAESTHIAGFLPLVSLAAILGHLPLVPSSTGSTHLVRFARPALVVSWPLWESDAPPSASHIDRTSPAQHEYAANLAQRPPDAPTPLAGFPQRIPIDSSREWLPPHALNPFAVFPVP